MPVAGNQHANLRQTKPLIDDLDCFFKRKSANPQPRMRHNAKKCRNTMQRNADGIGSGEDTAQICACGTMLRSGLVVGIEKDVRIENDHRCKGPSSISINSETEPEVHSDGRPTFFDLTLNG